jgi:transcriptional regulator with XRE-family HTH domain
MAPFSVAARGASVAVMPRRRTPNAIDPRVMNRVREFRVALGLSIEDLAIRTGLDEQKIRRVETGETRLTVDELPLFAEALGRDPADLVRSRRLELSDDARRIAELFEYGGLDESVRAAIRTLAEPGQAYVERTLTKKAG